MREGGKERLLCLPRLESPLAPLPSRRPREKARTKGRTERQTDGQTDETRARDLLHTQFSLRRPQAMSHRHPALSALSLKISASERSSWQTIDKGDQSHWRTDYGKCPDLRTRTCARSGWVKAGAEIVRNGTEDTWSYFESSYMQVGESKREDGHHQFHKKFSFLTSRRKQTEHS